MTKKLLQIGWVNFTVDNNILAGEDTLPFDTVLYPSNSKVFNLLPSGEITIASGNKDSYLINFNGVLENAPAETIKIDLINTLDDSILGSYYSTPDGKNISGTIVVDIPNEGMTIALVNNSTNIIAGGDPADIVFAVGTVPQLVISSAGLSQDVYQYMTNAAMVPMTDQEGALVEYGGYIDFGFDPAKNLEVVTNPNVINFEEHGDGTTTPFFTTINFYEQGYYNLDFWFSINGSDAPEYLQFNLVDLPASNLYDSIDDITDINATFTDINGNTGVNLYINEPGQDYQINPLFFGITPDDAIGEKINQASNYPVSTTGQIVGSSMLKVDSEFNITYPQFPRINSEGYVILDELDAPVIDNEVTKVVAVFAIQNLSGNTGNKVMISSKSGDGTMQGNLKVFGSHKLVDAIPPIIIT